MKKIIFLLVLIALIQVNKSQAQFKIVGYIPNWIPLKTFSDNFDYTRVTHLNLAFKDPDASGNLPMLSASEVYLISAAHSHGVKVLLSLCGGSSSTNASKQAIYFNLISSANVSGFASKLRLYTDTNNLDGLDLDLEGAAINSDYGKFVQVLADSLHPIGKVLSAALSSGYGGANVPTSTFSYFDWINIMAYDACGPTWGNPGQHSSYQFADDALIYWKGRGLSKSKAILGVPFYGYGFGASFSTSAYPFSSIAASYPADVYSDETANTIYYNGIATIIQKTQLAKTSGGGIMIWDLSLDATGANSLLSNIRFTAGSAVTATIESIDNKALSVFPNPSNGIVTLQGIDLLQTKVEIYNTLGEKIDLPLNGYSIDLSGKPKGIYYLHVTKESTITLRKIILQ